MTIASSNGWASVQLGEVLSQVKRDVTVESHRDYELLGARWYAKGLYSKAIKSGTQIKASKLYRVVAGDFVYNRLFAWKGSFAVASNENDGCFVSNEFPCFGVDRERALPEYLWYYFSRESAWNEALGLSYGATPTSRNRLKEQNLLAMSIPLPPLAEQRRIVAKIDHLAAKIEEAHRLKHHIERDVLAMLRGTFAEISKDAPQVAMPDAAPLIRRKVEVKMGEEYPELGIRCFGNGTFTKPSLNFLSVGNKKLYYIEPGDLLFSNVFAWEGAIAVAGLDARGRVGSHRFITCLPDPKIATAEYLRFYFLTQEGLSKIGDASPGGAGRNRTLGLKKLEKLSVPLAPLEKQEWFNSLQAQVDDMKHLQEKTATELDALLPSILDRAFKGEL